MKKILIAVFLALSFLSGCSNNVETFSFMEATGVEVSNILDITVSPGVAYSIAWPYYGDYSFLNTQYVKEEFNIYDEFFDSQNQDGDDAICLHVTTDILLETYPTQNYTFNLYISKSSHYLYYGIDGDFSFRSLNKISESTINQLLKQNGDNDEYVLTANKSSNSNISPDFPSSGWYKKGTKISYKVEIVTDVTFYSYLNDERLYCYKDDGFLGGYQYYEFIMPEEESILTLTSDEFYINREYHFNELFSWINSINEENVKSIRIEDGYIGVNPETANPTITYSEDKRDITYNLSVLSEPLKKTYYDIDGGSYREIYFILEETEYCIRIDNGQIFWNDFSSYQYFRFDRTPSVTFGISYPNVD
jgi:hypothetical protein